MPGVAAGPDGNWSSVVPSLAVLNHRLFGPASLHHPMTGGRNVNDREYATSYGM